MFFILSGIIVLFFIFGILVESSITSFRNCFQLKQNTFLKVIWYLSSFGTVKQFPTDIFYCYSMTDEKDIVTLVLF